MAKLKILKEGDPTLRRKSRPVTEITPRILLARRHGRDHARACGCGLAAPQVGCWRVVVIETPENGLLS